MPSPSATTASLNIDPRLHMQPQQGVVPTITNEQDVTGVAGVVQDEAGPSGTATTSAAAIASKADEIYAEYQRRAAAASDAEAEGEHVAVMLKNLPANALPPNLDPAELRELYAQAAAQHGTVPPPAHGSHDPHMQHHLGPEAYDEAVYHHQLGVDADMDGGAGGVAGAAGGAAGRRKKAGEMGNAEDWTRQRKDNHKEVERRRRGAINQGINELSALMPTNGSSDKAKGAILTRAVQYIRSLKENETRNIEKWTLEKLLMDQAMGDLQATIDETRRRWEEERVKTVTLESQIEMLKTQVASLQVQLGEATGSAGDAGGAGSKRQRTE